MSVSLVGNNTNRLSRATSIPSPATGYTVAGWFRWTDASPPQCAMWTLGRVSTGYALQLANPSATDTTLQVWYWNGFSVVLTDPGVDWIFAAVTVLHDTPVAGDVNIDGYYGSGSGALTHVNGTTGIVIGSANTLWIGADGLGDEGSCDITGFRIWDAILTQEQIDVEYRRIKPSRTANLNTYLPLLNNTAPTKNFGSAGDMTLTGSASSSASMPSCSFGGAGGSV